MTRRELSRRRQGRRRQGPQRTSGPQAAALRRTGSAQLHGAGGARRQVRLAPAPARPEPSASSAPRRRQPLLRPLAPSRGSTLRPDEIDRRVLFRAGGASRHRRKACPERGAGARDTGRPSGRRGAEPSFVVVRPEAEAARGAVAGDAVVRVREGPRRGEEDRRVGGGGRGAAPAGLVGEGRGRDGGRFGRAGWGGCCGCAPEREAGEAPGATGCGDGGGLLGGR